MTLDKVWGNAKSDDSGRTKIQCNKCKLSSWYNESNTAHVAVCPWCGNEQPLRSKLGNKMTEVTKIPKPNISIRTGQKIAVRTPDAEFEQWRHHAGIENAQGKTLTEAMIRKWAKDPNRRLECAYDGETWPSNYWYCPRCREYKGLQPYISEWSDWG